MLCTDRPSTGLRPHDSPQQSAGNILLPTACGKPGCDELPPCDRYPPAMPTFDLAAALARCEAFDAREDDTRQRFHALLTSTSRCFWRDAFPAHFTASAWLVSGDGERALLMHHRKLDRWLQPGGHADGDANLPQVALREAEEETGLRGLEVEAAVFDLDAHEIPARGQEPAHWHYDVRFVVRAAAGEAFKANEESRAMAWRPVSEIADDLAIDPSIRRMALRWLNRARAAAPRNSSGAPTASH